MGFSRRFACLLGAVALTSDSALAFSGLPLRGLPTGMTKHPAACLGPHANRVPPRAKRASVTVRMADAAPAETEKAWTPAGMTVEDFYERSLGSWRSLRSSHNIAFAQLEEVNSDIDITKVDIDDPELIQVSLNSDYLRLQMHS